MSCIACFPHGDVTVGIGHNVTAHADLAAIKTFKVQRFERKAVKGGDRGTPIPLTARIKGREATPDEIRNDYDFLIKHRGLGRYLADQLEAYTTVELSGDDVKSLFWNDMGHALDDTVREFGKDTFAGFPVSCQAALEPRRLSALPPGPA